MPGRSISQYSIQRMLLTGLLAFFLSGCISLADPETSQIHQLDVVYTLPANGIDWVGQTFVSRREQLNSITIHVSLVDAASPSAGVLIVELFHSPDDTAPIIHAVNLPIREGAIRIALPVQDSPPNQMYFLKLRSSGRELQIKGRAEDIYAYGEVYANGRLLQGDLAFSTSYQYDLFVLLDDFKNALPESYLLLSTFIVLLLPGFFLLILVLPRGQFDLGEIIALSAGLSLAALPLLMLWTGSINLSWNKFSVWIGALALWLGTCFLLWRQKPWRKWQLDYFDICLVVVFLASLTIRLIMVRDMAGTAWIDSVHHGLLTRLILELGKFPSNFLPFFDISPTDYHPGFHTSVAALSWFSGASMDRAMLLFGQVMNTLVVFSVYIFTKTLTQSKLAGLVAALVTGLCTPMPAYYTTWGRYTQLAGTVILPIPLALFQKGLGDAKDSWRYMAAACIAAAGLFLVHYRMITFLAILMGLYILTNHLTDKTKWQGLRRTGLLALSCVLATSLLALPWLIPTISQTIIPLSGSQQPANVKWFSGFSWRYLDTGLGIPVMAFTTFGLGAALLLRQRFGYLIVLWVAGLFLLANPTKIGLPDTILNNISVAIFLFFPMSALAGYAIDLVVNTWRTYLPRLLKPLMTGLLIAGLITGYLGIQRLLPILNPGTILLRQADLRALNWASSFLPDDAEVVINPFLWGYGIYAGSDGGFWLAPIAGVRTIPPPVLSAMQESSSYSELSKQIVKLGKDSSGLADLLRGKGIEYIYLGARGGAISPAALKADPQYDVLYQDKGVWIFQLSEK